MDFINKIGQRRVAKILFVLAIVLCAVEFGIKKNFNDILSLKFLFAVILFAGSSGVLAIAAQKTREYRQLSLVLSATMIFVNAILFYLNVLEFLFAITIGELIFSVVFTFLISSSNKKQKEASRKLKTGAKTKTVTQDITEKEMTNE